MIAEQLTAPVAEHGEGPIWDTVVGRLRWVDMLRGDVLTLGPDGSIDRLHVGDVAGAIRARADGGLVVGVERGFALVDADGTVHALDELWSDPAIRMNDGGCDPHGRFFCGSMAYDATTGAGSLHRLDPDGTTDTVLTDVTISNGLVWCDDGTALYVDSATQRVDRLEYDAARGTFGERRPFVAIDEADGTPDGIALDGDGGLWVALWNGSAVRRYGPDGTLDAVVEVDARNVTACALHDGALFITTSTTDDAEHGAAGALFRADVDVADRPLDVFAG